jgi:hypothetical protein
MSLSTTSPSAMSPPAWIAAPRRPRRRTRVTHPARRWRAALVLLALCAVVSCGPREKDFTFLVRDVQGSAVAGIEVRLAGQDRPLGVTDDRGRVVVPVRATKGAALRFRLADTAKPGPSRYRFPDVVEVGAAALQSGVTTIWLEAAEASAGDTDQAGPVTLRITSEPPGSEAFLDGNKVGVTPAVLADVPSGRHQLEVRMGGRQPYTLDVVLVPPECTFHADLPRIEEAKASLRVTSDPPGARILLDGQPAGQATPATLDGLAPGRHALRLSLDGYEPFDATVDLAAGGPGGSAGGALRPVASVARDREQSGRRPPEGARDAGFSREYLVGTAPGFAEVYLDSENTNRNVLGRFKVTLSGGRHTFRVLNSRAGVDVSLQFDVKKGDVNGRLVLNYASGQVEARP